MKPGETAMAKAARRATGFGKTRSYFNASQTDAMLARTTGVRRAQRFRPNNVCDRNMNVEMKWPVIVRRVVLIEPVLDHLIDEPAVDAFVEMWRFEASRKNRKTAARPRISPEHPVAFQRMRMA